MASIAERIKEKLLPEREDCVHTACYCEENVWQLCSHVRSHGNAEQLDQCWAVFISNNNRQIPIWRQGASTRPDGLVVWDYHVIMVAKPANHSASHDRHLVYDLDTTLPFPSDFDMYVEQAFRSLDLGHMFRAVPAREYLAQFASDRSHMLKEDGVTYMATPPEYAPIKTQHSDNNIQDFISMDTHVGYGTVMDTRTFVQRFYNNSS